MHFDEVILNVVRRRVFHVDFTDARDVTMTNRFHDMGLNTHDVKCILEEIESFLKFPKFNYNAGFAYPRQIANSIDYQFKYLPSTLFSIDDRVDQKVIFDKLQELTGIEYIGCISKNNYDNSYLCHAKSHSKEKLNNLLSYLRLIYPYVKIM